MNNYIEDLKSQIQRAEEFLVELQNSLNCDCVENIVSRRTINIAQEINVKIRKFYDQLIHFVFNTIGLLDEKAILTTFKLYFPIYSKKEDFIMWVKKYQFDNSNSMHQKLIEFLDSIQIYNGNKMLFILSKLSNESHIKLTTQIVKTERRTSIYSQSGSVTFNPDSVTFGEEVYILNQKINPTTKKPYSLDNLTTKDELLCTFIYDEYQINVLGYTIILIEASYKALNSMLGIININ